MITDIVIGPLVLRGETAGGHVHVTARGAGVPGSRALVGTLTLSLAEWSALAAVAELEDLARRQVERDRLEIGRLQVQRDQTRRELDELQPVLSVLGDWEWSTIVEDGCVDDDALERAAKALAEVEKARKDRQ